MTPAQKELLRITLLAQLDEARQGITAQSLAFCLKAAAFKLSAEDVEREMEYLISKGFATQERSGISAGLKLYKITAAGTDYLEANA